MPRLGSVTGRVGPALPGGLVAAGIIWCSFRAGGYFPGTPAVLAVVACLGLLLWLTLARRPLAGVSPALLVAAVALAFFAGWQLLSSTWSHAPGRAAIEADRTLLYLLVLLAAGVGARSQAQVRWLVRGIVLAAFVVAVAALASRLTPDLTSIGPQFTADRLSYPLTYWNALGLLMVVGCVFALQLAADLDEPLPARILGAAALPALATTVLLTLSRGAIAAGFLGLVIYLVLGRPRGAVSALGAALPAAAVVIVAYHASDLTSVSFASPAGVREGHRVAVVLAAGTIAAAVLRFLLVALDRRVHSRTSRGPRRRLRLGAALAGVVVVAILVAAGAPGAVRDRARGFVERPHAVAQARQRLTDPSNNGRVDLWHVALVGWHASPLHGAGAGTFETAWARRRPTDGNARDGHSLYLEVLGELGWPGLVVLVVALGAIVIAHVRRRREARALHSAVLAATLVWALHAAVDWDWEMPALTLWVFAAGGLNLAARPGIGRLAALAPPRLARVGAGLACLLMALLPLSIARSQAPLEEALSALRAADCPRAVDRALASIDALGLRPEPYEVLGYCDTRAGRPALGLAAMRQAVKLDPQWWETHYGLALLQAADGQDPRRAARAARALDPRSPLAQGLATAMTSASRPAEWRRRAFRARLPLR